ncbi:hypothetical protein [Corynebacterium sp. 335C]
MDGVTKARQDFQEFLAGRKSLEQLKRDLDRPGTRDPGHNARLSLEEDRDARIDVWGDIQVEAMVGGITRAQEAELFSVIDGTST